MFKAINGWTKAKMLKVIRARRYNVPAVSDDGSCVYLAKNGNRCAVGLFIPKGHEGLQLSGGVDDLLQNYPDLANVLPLESEPLRYLQSLHDHCSKDISESGKTENAKEAMIKWVKANVA